MGISVGFIVRGILREQIYNKIIFNYVIPVPRRGLLQTARLSSIKDLLINSSWGQRDAENVGKRAYLGSRPEKNYSC